MIDMDELVKSWEIFRDKMIFALTGKGEQTMINRERAIEGLKLCEIGSGDKCYETECPYYGQECTESLKNDILELLKEQEAKTGKWIEKTDYMGDTYYDCSVCGESWTTIDGTPWQNGMNYCPHCGSKMKLEQS